MYSKKLKVLIYPTCVTSRDIHDALMVKYDIMYCGIYSHGDEVSVYIQNKTKMAKSVVEKLLNGTLDIRDVSVYSKVQGDPLCQSGTLPKHGGKRVSSKPRSPTVSTNINNITNNTDNSVNTNNNADQRVAINNFFPVALNPLGSETMDHITTDSMASCYDDPMSNGVVMNFSDLLYGVHENLNFRCSSKSSTCKAFTEAGWVSEEKNIGYDMLYQNITEKSLEALDKFKDGISDEMEKKHRDEIKGINNLKIDMEVEGRVEYAKYRNAKLNLLGENISNQIKNYQLKNGKRLKFT